MLVAVVVVVVVVCELESCSCCSMYYFPFLCKQPCFALLSFCLGSDLPGRVEVLDLTHDAKVRTQIFFYCV